MRSIGPFGLLGFIMSSTWELAACSRVGIIGGKQVKPHSSPWMASIQVNNNHICGGTLIKDQWILTAAHCKENFRNGKPSVLLGAHSLKDEKNTLRIGMQNCQIPSTYNKVTKVDDLMLIKLEKPAKTKLKTVKAKGLPNSGKDLAPGTKCQVIGWGATNPKKLVASDTLQGAEVKIIDRELCDCFYNKKPAITENMLCARNEKTNADACKGDSGGPLVCKRTLAGLVSGGDGDCGNPKKPGVYTRLSKSHLAWINNIIRGDSNATLSEGFIQTKC